MTTTRIKFCGITRLEDLQLAISLGVHALGFVFYPPSPRAIDVQQAKLLSSYCPPFVARVGLFMNQNASTIKEVLQQVPLEVLQFHGDEEKGFCDSFAMPYIKSIAMGSEHSSEDITRYASASALLLDGNELGQPGGAGGVFNWHNIPQQINQPIILAGGLHAHNVTAAIQQVRPFAVDVSSGIESAKGIKDIEKMKQFVQAVRAAEG